MSLASHEDSVRLDLAVDRFEDAWQRGERPAIEPYLAESDDTALLIELVHVDLERRLKAGETVRVEDYVRRFPALGREPQVLVELAAAEFRLRRRHEPTLTHAEYVRRFPEYTERITHLLSSQEGSEPPSTQPHPPPDGSCNGHFELNLDAEVATQSHYRVLHPHARGGLGEILVARDEGLQREVALKLLQRALARNPDARRRFLWEARITSQLEHPGIVPLYGVGQASDGSPVYAMRFIRGETLQEAVRRFRQAGGEAGARSVDFRQLLGRFVSVCNTIAYAHSKGVIHRDLKPGNIMLGEYGETVVVDWGLAKAMHERPPAEGSVPPSLEEEDPVMAEATRDGVIVGTPPYMSPEQAAGKWDEVGTASDIYSLGATLYVLLTGQPPFDEAPVNELLERVRRGDFPRPVQSNRTVPPALEAICLRAMAALPGVRYPTALALANDVEHWLANEPVGAWPEPVRVRVARWLGRHPALVTGTGITLVAAVGLAVVTSLFLAERSQRKLDEVETRAQAEKVRLDLDRADEDRKRLEQTEHDFYLHRITWADLEWHSRNLPAAQRRLDECKPEQRRWEWYYLKRRCQGALLTLQDHHEVVWGVAYSPDGQRLVSAGLDGTLKVWDTATGRLLLTFTKHQGPVWGLAFDPQGRWVASGGADHVVRLWDPATGTEIRTFRVLEDEVQTLAFSADGKLLGAACIPPRTDPRGTGRVKIWDPATGEEKLTLAAHGSGVYGIAFRPDGQQFCTTGMDKKVKVWDAHTGRPVATLFESHYLPHAVQYSPDGRLIAVAGGADGLVHLWDAATGKEQRPLIGHYREVWGVAFRADGKLLASSSDDQTVRLWDPVQGSAALVLSGHSRGIANVAFSPDGSRVASASDDHTVKIWDPSQRRDGMILSGHAEQVRGIALSRDSRALASVSKDNTVKLWDVESGQLRHSLRVAALAAAFRPDGRLLAVAGMNGLVTLWDVESGECRGELHGQSGTLYCLAFSPDGRRLASAGENRTIRVWDIASSEELLTLRGHTGVVHALVFTPDGRRIVSGGADSTVRVWDAVTGTARRTLAGHGSPVLGLAMSPDGHTLASCSAQTVGVITREPGDVRVWDLDSEREPLVLTGQWFDITGVAFSPDGQRLVSASADGSLKLWEPATGQEILTIADHAASVLCVAFTPDGKRLASGAADGSILVRNGMPGE